MATQLPHPTPYALTPHVLSLHMQGLIERYNAMLGGKARSLLKRIREKAVAAMRTAAAAEGSEDSKALEKRAAHILKSGNPETLVQERKVRQGLKNKVLRALRIDGSMAQSLRQDAIRVRGGGV